MATGHLSQAKTAPPRLPALENGDRLDQKTFHERYEAMPSRVRAELIGGIVYMASPQKNLHGRSQGFIAWWLGVYAASTGGTDVLIGSTSILGPDSEPQPDSCLRILSEHGGQSWEDEDNYLNGAPELVAEVAWATESIDLHAKKSDYEKAGVREYIVIALRQRQVFWFIRRRGKFRRLLPGKDGVLRSEIFPGLWLDPEALLANERDQLLTVLRQGLASPEHASFAAKLSET
jgi:Uma2 family endonuclease